MKKWFCLLLSLLFAFSSLSLCAGAVDEIRDVPFDYEIYPELSAYSKDMDINICVKIQNTALTELRDLCLWLDYPLTDYYLTPGASERFVESCNASTLQKLRVGEDAGVLRLCTKLGRTPFLRHLFLRLAHGYKSLTLLFATVQYRLQNGFVFRSSEKLCLGTTTVLFDGTEIPFTVYCRYTALSSVPCEAVRLTDRSGKAGALVRAVKNTYTGMTFAMEADGSFGLFAVNPDFGKAYLFRVQDGKYFMLSSKTVALTAGREYPMEVLFENNRVICTLRDDAHDAAPYPAFDLFYTAESSGYGVFCPENGYKNFECTPGSIPQPAKTYQNPVCDNVADPFILRDGNTYYLYATNAPSDGFYVSKSEDLVNWTALGLCAQKGDIYGKDWFWAPEVYAYGGKYYLLYSTDEHLALAVSDTPVGPFHKTQDNYLLPDKCIDGNLLFDEDGTIYLYMAYWGKTGEEIRGCKLSPDFSGILPGTLTKLTTTKKDEGRINEGPFMLRHEGKYYLTYSINNYEQHSYAVRLAVSDSPLGKYSAQGTILEQSGPLVGTGHHCFTTSPDGSEMIIAYHAHASVTQIHARKLCIDRAKFVKTDTGYTIRVYGPTATPQPVPAQ